MAPVSKPNGEHQRAKSRKASINRRVVVCIFGAAFLFLLLMGVVFVVYSQKSNSNSQEEALIVTGEVEEIKIQSASCPDSCDLSEILNKVVNKGYPCYSTHTWYAGEAVFKIPYSIVTKISYRSSIDSDATELFQIKTCWSGRECFDCDQVELTFIMFYVSNEINCDSNGTGVNEIRVHKPSNAPRLCHLEVYGQVAMKEAVRQLAIYWANGNKLIEGGEHLTLRHSIINAMDGVESTSSADCYVSEEPTNALATFDVPWSLITHMSVLNAADYSGNVEGIFASVCELGDESSCSPCGVFRKTDPGEWSTVYCTGSYIIGNQVRLVHSYQRLVICEVQVFGMEKTARTGMIDAVEIFYSNADIFTWGEVNMGCPEPGSRSFHRSDSDRLEYEMMPAIVHRVQFLNCNWEGCYQQSIRFEVCDDSGLCHLCGYANSVDKYESVTVECDTTNRLKATRLRPDVSRYDGFCEIQIFGETDV